MLISALTPAEKKNYRLYCGRYRDETDAAYLALFNIIDKKPEGTEKDWESQLKLEAGNTVNYAKLKRYVYHSILRFLRIHNTEQTLLHKIIEAVEESFILLQKGLFKQAENLLKEARSICVDDHNDLMHIFVIDNLLHLVKISKDPKLRKEIDTMYREDSAKLIENLEKRRKLDMINNQFRLMFSEHGEPRNAEDRKRLLHILAQCDDTLHSDNEDLELSRLNLKFYFEKYSDHPAQALAYAEQAFNIQTRTRDLGNVIHGFNNLQLLGTILDLSFRLDESKAEYYLGLIKKIRTANYTTSQYKNLILIKYELYRHMRNNVEAGATEIPEMEKWIQKNRTQLEETHYVFQVYYVLATYHFHFLHYGRAVEYINRILNTKMVRERLPNLYGNTLLVNLINQMELGNIEVMENLLRTTIYNLKSLQLFNEPEQMVTTFVKKFLQTTSRKEKTELLLNLKDQFTALQATYTGSSEIHTVLNEVWIDHKISSLLLPQDQ